MGQWWAETKALLAKAVNRSVLSKRSFSYLGRDPEAARR
jgi:hypothetical protein